MLHLNFRTKLLLAMMIVVAGVSGATLLVTQRRVQENYEHMFRKQFERQISYSTALQESRLGAVKRQCLKLSRSVRLISLMNEPEMEAERLYQIADDELREVSESPQSEPRSAEGGLRHTHAAFFCFLDPAGKALLRPDNPGTHLLNQAIKRRLESKLTFVREVLASAQIQQVGYLAVTDDSNTFGDSRLGWRRASILPHALGDDDAPTLQEVIVTKVIDPADKRTLGSLVLGFPMFDLVPPTVYPETNSLSSTSAGELIQTGILLEGLLYANTNAMPVSLAETLARRVSENILTMRSPRADFSCVLGGLNYRAFYELMNDPSAFPPAYQVCLYPMTEAQREQTSLRWKILGSGSVALILGLALSLFIAHGLSAPIRDLVVGTREIQRGNFQVRVPVRSPDEIGQLTASFNQMAEGLAQKEKYRKVLNMVADEQIAQQLLAGELTLGGELRKVTVLFCDIRGFTALTQNMPPGEVIEMLNEHMTALTRVVKEHHGVLDKFVGDLLMAIFGAPISHGDDALNASYCALRLQQVRAELNGRSRHKLEIGIGLATGTAVAGCMGSEDRLNYTVLGERVNLASRLCGQAKAGEVLVDEATWQQLQGRICGEPTGEIQLKGFATPVKAFRLARKQTR